MVRTIDRYVARNYLFSYLVVLVAFLGLAVAIDASMNLDEFMENVEHEDLAPLTRASRVVGIMANWYAVRVPLFFQMLMPIITVVAAVVTVVTLKRRNELVPLLASGVSVYRALWPIMFLALLASGLGVANQEMLLPRLAYRLVRKADDPHGREPRILEAAFDDADGNLINAFRYTPATRTMTKVLIRGPEREIAALAAVWNEDRECWRLTDGWVQAVNADGTKSEKTYFGDNADTPAYDFHTDLRPSHVDRPMHWIKLSSAEELVARIRKRADQPRLRVELHSRYVVPLNAVILLLLGLPLVLMQESKSVMVGLGIGMVICLSYLGVQFISQQLGNSERLAPILSVWLPIFIFGPVAIILFDSVRT